jgi:ubiquinone/menaquinone biosynthesis C-methylase UbiE
MTRPTSLFGAADAAAAYESNLVQRVFLPFAEHLVARVAPTPDEDVLDLACGTGAVTRLLAERGDPSRITGLDLTDAMLDVARRLVPGVTFVHGDMTALPTGDGSVDVVVCQQGLQFVPDRAAAATEMARVLRPGGRLAVSCWTDVTRSPVFNGFREAVLVLGWDDLDTAFAAPFSLPGAELREVFEDVGLAEVRVEEVVLELPMGNLREVARTYASVPPFAARFTAATDAERERYLDAAVAGVDDPAPFTTTLLTAVR